MKTTFKVGDLVDFSALAPTETSDPGLVIAIDNIRYAAGDAKVFFFSDSVSEWTANDSLTLLRRKERPKEADTTPVRASGDDERHHTPAEPQSPPEEPEAH
jgi:hypothetical protein